MEISPAVDGVTGDGRVLQLERDAVGRALNIGVRRDFEIKICAVRGVDVRSSCAGGDEHAAAVVDRGVVRGGARGDCHAAVLFDLGMAHGPAFGDEHAAEVVDRGVVRDAAGDEQRGTGEDERIVRRAAVENVGHGIPAGNRRLVRPAAVGDIEVAVPDEGVVRHAAAGDGEGAAVVDVRVLRRAAVKDGEHAVPSVDFRCFRHAAAGDEHLAAVFNVRLVRYAAVEDVEGAAAADDGAEIELAGAHVPRSARQHEPAGDGILRRFAADRHRQFVGAEHERIGNAGDLGRRPDCERTERFAQGVHHRDRLVECAGFSRERVDAGRLVPADREREDRSAAKMGEIVQ